MERVARIEPSRRDSRLPVPIRWLAGLAGLVVLAANTTVLLSDRAPGLLRRLSDRLDASTLQMVSTQVTPGRQLAESDFMIHVALWAMATALVGLAMGSTWSRTVAAGTVLAYSAGLELAQGVFTSGRSPHLSDMAGNAVGVAAGLALAVTVGFLMWCRPPGGSGDA